MVRLCLLAVLLSCLASAQRISVGVTGGVPISPHSQDDGEKCFNLGPPICGPNKFFTRPYSIGPTVNVNLLRGFSVEGGFLYERFHKDLAHGLRVAGGSPVNFGEKYSVSADAWLFPLLLKYTFGQQRVAPFVNAGATLRLLGAFEGEGTQLSFDLQPQPTSVHIDTRRDLNVGITAGAGIRWRVSVIDVAPEIRFVRWTSQHYQPVQNQAMLMLSLTFPARR